MYDLSTTLVAVGTPPGRGGIGCLRLSGADARSIAERLFRPAEPGRTPRPGGRPRFGAFLDRAGRPLDHGYLVLFGASASYTGELTAELWSHGSPAVLSELVASAVAAGARPAGPGEFTYRAVRNGRLDLTRAEAVRDLIAARTAYQARVAFSQAEGALARRLAPLEEALEEWIARAEAAVEFVDESETQLPPRALPRAVVQTRDACERLLAGFRAGRVVRDGARMAIVGLPNVGKSALFNRLLDQDRAIVTEIAGTTRDTLEEELDVGGIPVRLIDTAGLRSIGDPVESEGVRRSRVAREEADLVLLVFDGSRPLDALELEALERWRAESDRRRTVAVRNKIDLPQAACGVADDRDVLGVSARTGEGIDELREELRHRLTGTGPLEDPILTDARHAHALDGAKAALDRAELALGSGLSEELVLEDLRQARRHLGEITGEFTSENLYDRIFSTFCIGK
jgi:tRNA modification GTPase